MENKSQEYNVIMIDKSVVSKINRQNLFGAFATSFAIGFIGAFCFKLGQKYGALEQKAKETK